jgi:2-keto-4-pentenoate hydratase
MSAQLAGLDRAPAGWKLGVGTAAAMEAAGTTGPLLGYLTAATRLDDGASVGIEGWTNPVIEPEIAIFVGADLEPGAGRDEAAAAISGLGTAFEVVDIDRPLSEVEELLAGDIFHRAYLLGAPVAARAGGLTDGLDLSVVKNGEEVARTDAPEAAVGNLVDLTLHTVSYLAAVGRRLEAGQFIISGSVVPPIPLAPGDSLHYSDGAELGRLQLNFA